MVHWQGAALSDPDVNTVEYFLITFLSKLAFSSKNRGLKRLLAIEPSSLP